MKIDRTLGMKIAGNYFQKTAKNGLFLILAYIDKRPDSIEKTKSLFLRDYDNMRQNDTLLKIGLNQSLYRTHILLQTA